MFIQEFHSRFSSREEESVLVEAVRRLSRLDEGMMVDEQESWLEWSLPPEGGEGAPRWLEWSTPHTSGPRAS